MEHGTLHLDDAVYADLASGRLRGDSARALARHLAEGCETCDAWLERSGARLPDGLADAALARAAPPAAALRGNDLEFARIQRRLSAGLPARRSGHAVAIAAGLVATLGVAFWAVKSSLRAPGDVEYYSGEKGAPSAAVPVRLQFLVAQGGALDKGVSGMAVPPGASLAFRVEAQKPADVALARVGGDGKVDIFWHQSLDRPGALDVTLGGRPAAYPMAQLSGPQRFVLVASPTPLDGPRIAAAARAIAPPARLSGDAPALDGLSLDVVDVTVK